MRCSFAVFLTVIWGISSGANAQYTLQDGSIVTDLQKFQECDACPEMIVLPMGDFLMGAPPGESRLHIHLGSKTLRKVTPEDPYIATHEGPVHRVVIDIPVAMGRNEITHDQWMACVNDGGCYGHVPKDFIFKINVPNPKIGGNHPVIDVSYRDALSYVKWLNEKVGADVYRLPTEAEWEYAARSGTQTPFAQGEEVTTDQANFSGHHTGVMLGEDRPDLVDRMVPVPVDQLDAANAWGLRHMSGNVAEQTMSCWTPTYIGLKTSSAYLAHALLPGCERRVARGGAYWATMDFSRVGARFRAREAGRLQTSGFRVLRYLKSSQIVDD